MKIEDLKHKERVEELELKIIWDKSEPVDPFGTGKMIKTVIVADVDGEQGSPTAYLDLVGDAIEGLKFGDKLKIKNGFSKQIKGKDQFRITNVKHFEPLE